MNVFTRPELNRDRRSVVRLIAPFGPGRVNNDLGIRRGFFVGRICKHCGASGVFAKVRGGGVTQLRICEACRSAIGRYGRRCRPLGDRYIGKDGYVYVVVVAGDGRERAVAEHRWVLERELGRPLRDGESVHHKNGVRDDNRPENLELWVGAVRYGQRARDLVCPHCERRYSDD